MRGLIQKDFYVMRKCIRPINYVYISIMILAILIYFQSAGTLYVAIFLPLLLVGVPKTLMVYDTQCKWDKLAIALPITRKKIIASRYLFFIILTTIMSIVSFVLCVVATIFFKDITFALCVKFSIAGFALALFYGLITIPTGYAMGSNGGPFAMMFSTIILLVVAYLLKSANIDLENIALLLADYAFIIGMAVLVIGGMVSYILSVCIYTKIHS